MDDFDEMKRKYTLISNNNYALKIGINMGDIPEDIKTLNINKTVHELNRYIVERGEVMCSKMKHTDGSIHIHKKDISVDTIEMLTMMERQIIQVPLPLYLYIIKDEIKSEIENLANEINIKARIVVKSHVFVCLCGRLDDILKFKKHMLLIVERILLKDAIHFCGYISSDFLIRNKVRVFFISKINGNEVILSGRKDLSKDLETYLKPKRDLIEQFLLVDTIKLVYMLYYLRESLENFLVENDCYMTNDQISGNFTKICIKGFNIVNTRKCLKRVKDLIQEIVKATYNDEDIIPNSYKIYTFEMNDEHCADRRYGYKYLAIGLRSELKRYIARNDTMYEMEIDIDPELEDFLCGKKNGKINKICKDNDCDVRICVKTEENEKKMVIYIKGKGYNLFSTIILLENEYPAELSFYLNEKHHRRIIGYGGKNIQKIMKKHGVYIKFMSDEEKYFSGYTGNVIIKTPRRNHESLQKMKEEVLIMADEIPDDREIPIFPIDYYAFYEYFFERYLMAFNHMEIQKDTDSNIKIYKIEENKIPEYMNDKENVFVLFENTIHRFMYSWRNYNCEIVFSSKWHDEEPRLSLKYFDSVLLYSYEPTFKIQPKIDDYRIDFTHKITKPPILNDEHVVGNRRNERDRSGK